MDFSPNATKDTIIREVFAYGVSTLPDQPSTETSNKAPSVQLNLIYN